jgi:hypothetical protein
MSATKHAVLFYPNRPFPNTAIMWIDGKGFHCEDLPDPCYTLSDLAEVAYKNFVTHLWVMPAYGDFTPIKGLGDWSFSCYENRKKQMMGAAARRRGHRQIDVNIIFPQHTSWYGTEKAPGWLRDVEPHDLLITLHYLEQALGITVTGSPGRTGWNYLKKLHPEWIEEIGIDLAACHFDRKAAADIIWQRDLLELERKKLYLHKFDEGGSYPYAATQTDFGVGTPVHVEHGEDARHEKGHPQAVGVWRCTISHHAYALNTPPTWTKDEGWLMGPMIRLLRATGREVTIYEGWVFPERRDLLTKWGNNLWAIRQAFSDPKWINTKCAALARQATKEIANKTIGITAFSEYDEGDEMQRPDIRLQTIARHRELTWHRIDKIRAMYGVTPILVYMDAFLFISDNPDGRVAFPEIVKRETQFGGYKYEGCIEITSDILEMFDTKMSEASRLEVLNKIGWKK